MTYSEIKITFTENLIEGSTLNIFNEFSDLATSNNWVEKWVRLRGQTNQVTTAVPTPIIGERAAIQFINAFQLDYNFPVQYEVTRFENEVTIKSMIPQQSFLGGELTLDEDPISGVTFEITNFVGTPYGLEEITFLQAIESCTKIKIGIKTTELSTSILSPFTLVGNADNPFYFDAFRSQGIIVTTKNAYLQQISFNVIVPDVLSADNFILQPSNTPNGGTLNIVKNNSYGLDVQYSINSLDWQSEPYFSGLTTGVYDLDIKDQYGCRINIPFFISEFNIQDSYFYYSKSNSIRIAERNNELPNDENTLSCESLVNLPYKEIQRFNSDDIITVQFKSNYEINKSKVIPENPIVIQEKSNIILHSEYLENAVWENTNLIISSEKAISNNTNGFHSILQNINKGSESGLYTFSFFAKKDEYKIIRISISNVAGNNYSLVNFNLDTLLFYGELSNVFSIISKTFTSSENGYYRVSIEVDLTTVSNIIARIEILNNSGQLQYIGNGVNGLYISKFQFQKGGLTPYLATTNTPEFVSGSDGTFNLPVIKKTNNIGNKEKRDAVIYKYSRFKSGIYFINGNIYNYDTNSIVGNYALNGLLPIWAQIGNYITIGSIWYLIENIVYVESKNADVMIISKVTVSPSGQSIIVGSIYNIQNYEVYETTVVMNDFLNQNIRLKIESSDSEFSSKNYLSEIISVKEKHENCLEILCFNKDNNDVFYQTGIEHLLRLPFTKINGYFDDSSENNKTDSTVISLNATLYEGNEFIFEPVTKEIWRKLAISLSHKFVFIDHVGYVKDGEIEVEGPLEDTNLYVVKAKMLKTGNVYSNLSKGDIILANDPVVEIPGMIEWDGGFIEQ